jgi:hypothetical protein
LWGPKLKDFGGGRGDIAGEKFLLQKQGVEVVKEVAEEKSLVLGVYYGRNG